MTRIKRVAERMIAGRWVLLALGLLLAALAWQPAQRVQFDRSIENMFAPDDPLLVVYQELKQRFGGNEIVMAVYVDPDLFAKDGSGIERVGKVSAALTKIDGIRAVLSLAEVNDALERTEQFGRFLGRSGPPSIVSRKSRVASAFRNVFGGYTHDRTGQIAVLVCMLEPASETSIPRRATIDAIRAVIGKQPHGMLAGEPVMVTDGFRYVELDGQRLGWWTTILLAIAIILCFRSLRWVAIPVLVVQFALIMTRATLVWAHLQLSMVSSMLTAIVTVVGVATVVHIIVRFRQRRTEGLGAREAMVRTVVILAAPIFWACTTDAVGFLSLTVAHVGPVKDFGVMTAVGCLWVLAGVTLLVPGLALCGRFDTDPHQAWGEGRLSNGLDRMVQWAQRYPVSLAASVLILIAFSVAGLMRLEVETDFTKNFRRGSSIVVSYDFIEQKLGGAGVWDIMIPAPAKLDREYLARVRQLESRLRALKMTDSMGKEIPALTKVLSLVDGIDAAATRRLLARLSPEIRARGMQSSMPEFVAALRTSRPAREPNYLRIMLRAREQQSAAAKSWLIAKVTEIAREEFPPTDKEEGAEVTGFYVLLTNLIKSMLSDQWVCFAVASLGIALMMLIALRSLRLALVALVPNVLPILLVLGAMGWLGFKINMGAAMIAAVSMGLSVDSSIHYITAFQRARAAGSHVAQALTEVQQTVGRAVFFSTLALIVGFGALCTSQFVPTIYFGSLVGLSMLGGLFGNLVVLPLLLSVVERDKTE